MKVYVNSYNGKMISIMLRTNHDDEVMRLLSAVGQVPRFPIWVTSLRKTGYQFPALDQLTIRGSLCKHCPATHILGLTYLHPKIRHFCCNAGGNQSGGIFVPATDRCWSNFLGNSSCHRWPGLLLLIQYLLEEFIPYCMKVPDLKIPSGWCFLFTEVACRVRECDTFTLSCFASL